MRIKQAKRMELLVSLTDVIDKWIESLDTDLPLTSDSTAASMAWVALTVLTAIDDAQETAIEDGYLVRPED